MHDFHERLAWSNSPEAEAFWQAAYQGWFGERLVVCVACPGDFLSQRQGIDRLILLCNGQTLTVEEKLRSRDREDLFLEFCSNTSTGAPGWICKPLTVDYLAYGFLDTRRAYLLDPILLQTAWRQFGDAWKKTYGVCSVKNRGYRTLGCPVPTNVVFEASNQMAEVRL